MFAPLRVPSQGPFPKQQGIKRQGSSDGKDVCSVALIRVCENVRIPAGLSDGGLLSWRTVTRKT